MKMYRADTENVEVHEMHVVETTEKSVVYLVQHKTGEAENRVERLQAKGHAWFRTRPQAVAWLRERTESNISELEGRVDYLRKKIGRLC